jgi:hypothetical protein
VPQHTSASRSTLALLSVGLLLAALTGCQSRPGAGTATARAASDTVEVATDSGPSPAALPALRGGRLRPDVLLTGRQPLSARELHQVAALAPGAVAFSSGTVHLSGKPVRVASVDPVTFRRYAAAGTAESTAVWQTVADGGLVASHDLAKRLHLPLGQNLKLIGRAPLALRLGALATTGIPGTDLVVGTATGRRLGLSAPTAVLLNAGSKDPVSLASKVRRLAGAGADVDLLTAPAANPVAFLTGSRAAKAFGAFSYKYYPDGTIEPDAAWVNANIVSATVPILGRVTCHRLMVPQLRGALQDVVNAGLASSLHTYDGCYVPRFIERDPSHAISLHTWGIAIDLDASTNYRGIKGSMDPRVVQIFKRWGFRWGGDWSYSDPMHFEIGALLSSPS